MVGYRLTAGGVMVLFTGGGGRWLTDPEGLEVEFPYIKERERKVF